MDLSSLSKERVLGVQDVLIICTLFCLLSFLCRNIFLSAFLYILNMQNCFFILMAIALLLALSETAWLAYIRGVREVSVSRVVQDGLICMLPLMIMALSTAALSVNR